MSKTSNYVFVLWADYFEEIAATIFISELRKAGLRVKVVSLTRQQTSGAHGLALVPDLTLSQALPLAAYAVGLIIPCELRVIQSLKSDPRLREFVSLLRANRAKFIMGALSEGNMDDLEALSLSPEEMIVYPASEVLIEFAREVAGLLLTI